MHTGRALTRQDPEMQPGSGQPAARGAPLPRGPGWAKCRPWACGAPRLEEAVSPAGPWAGGASLSGRMHSSHAVTMATQQGLPGDGTENGAIEALGAQPADSPAQDTRSAAALASKGDTAPSPPPPDTDKEGNWVTGIE